ncbi:MAG: hypothetical protein H0X51_02120 [Parachlamydiaceae bacterium]|nr:hypothetical protein [Parachlamydiaceae bacterium]
MIDNTRRLFFGFDVASPWPTTYPNGRLIDPASRHLTLAFLGNVSFKKLEDILPTIPQVMKVGPVGMFNHCLFLPEKHPHVVSWNIDWFDERTIQNFQEELVEWLRHHQYPIEKRSFLSHVSVARAPFEQQEWLQAFAPLPVIVQGFHLYESVGNLTYNPVWSFFVEKPFEELSHTADVAYLVKAESLSTLHLNAQLALAFTFPPFLKYIKEIPLKNSLDDIVIALNELITQADCDGGCPLKAVSFHGDVEEKEGIFSWEMIVDV